jgi:hypothetical protein
VGGCGISNLHFQQSSPAFICFMLSSDVLNKFVSEKKIQILYNENYFFRISKMVKMGLGP